MRCKCLVMDHDDTTVNSTATIHFPSFCAYLQLVRPQAHYTLEEYFRKNFDPGILPLFTGELGFNDEELEGEFRFWQDWLRTRNPWPLERIMARFALRPEELLVVDDLKPGHDMARAAGVPFAAAGWANDIPEIEQFMRKNCDHYCKQVSDLARLLEEA